jgi:hypothetical protein
MRTALDTIAAPVPPDREGTWATIAARNPLILTGGSMTPSGYRRFFEYVWQAAQRHAAHTRTQTARPVPPFLADLFPPRR